MTEKTMSAIEISIILPTWNERGNIGPLLRAIRDHLPAAELIVVDDASDDGTVEEAHGALPGDGLVRIHKRSGPRGLAASILDGIRLARGEAIAVMDTDFSHDPALLPIMTANLAFFDLVSGSRYVHGGGMYSNARYTLSHLFNLFARYYLGTRLTDHLSGFFAIRRTALDRLATAPGLDAIFTGYGDFHIRLLFHLVRSGARIIEIPSWYQDRAHGVSKTRFIKTFLRYTAAVLSLRFHHGSAWRRPKP
jgi:dolichol-phosphate mannosyltransferase